ncbi:MAG: HlyC/CorC family transporter [Xanthomonadales bacterium]|nr:HlyC/CorC family transporter [Xanthomonadales bacterium]
MPTEIAILLGLILLNGAFALSEMAVITARKSRLKQMAASSRGARAALRLAEKPQDFLSTVQVGITLVAILTGLLGGRAFGAMITGWLNRLGWEGPAVEKVGVVSSVVLITFATIVLGELVPKRLGMLASERVAALIAIPLEILARICHPIVVLLSAVSRTIVRLLGFGRRRVNLVSEEEIRMLVAESAEQGVIEPVERRMVNRVLRLGDRPVEALMTPRRKICWLDVQASLADNLATMQSTPYSRYPVKSGSDADVMGVVEVKSLVENLVNQEAPDLFASMVAPLYVPEGTPALTLVGRFHDAQTQMALVVDEYGDILGLLTTDDLLSAVLGSAAHTEQSPDSPLVRRPDGSLLVAGALATEELRDALGGVDLAAEAEEYHTVAGIIMAQFGHVPRVGEALEWAGVRFEVVALDGAHIERLLVTPLDQEAPAVSDAGDPAA